MTHRIRQEVELPAPPANVYAALSDGDTFGKVTGAPASMEPVAGGSFAFFGERIVGRNVELVDGKRVVQAWRAVSWPEGVYSLVHLELEASETGTKVTLSQAGHPESETEHLVGGWHTNYWDHLKKFFS